MRVEYSFDVEDDLDEIAAYIAVDNPRRAVTFIQEIRAEIDRIGKGLSYTNCDPTLAKMRGWPWSAAM